MALLLLEKTVLLDVQPFPGCFSVLPKEAHGLVKPLIYTYYPFSYKAFFVPKMTFLATAR